MEGATAATPDRAQGVTVDQRDSVKIMVTGEEWTRRGQSSIDHSLWMRYQVPGLVSHGPSARTAPLCAGASKSFCV